MLTLKEWLKTDEVKTLQAKKPGENMTQDFFRDPMRTIFYNPDVFYAPADGVVLYAKEFKADDFLEIKGKDFTLKEMLQDDEFEGKAMVVGIFMTSYSVHINRVPASSYYIECRKTNQIITHNVSMLVVEHDLFNDFNYDKKGLSYLYSNERRVNVFYAPTIRQRYYVVQVGDKDIDVIQNWGKGKYLLQGRRFGQIRWGSQCDLVIPLTNNIQYKALVKPMDYVEAGKDAVVGIL